MSIEDTKSAGAFPIRIIGDAILHRPVPAVSLADPVRLQQIMVTMLACLRAQGGIGLACNQCANIDAPVAILLIGTDDPVTRQLAIDRYPDMVLPWSTWLINPQLSDLSEDSWFPPNGEGCLSVPGGLRARIRRHRRLRLGYQTPTGETITRDCEGMEAHIIQHEYDHLQGIVFIQRLFADCSPAQRTDIAHYIRQERQRRDPAQPPAPAALPVPMMVFEREGNAVTYMARNLQLALQHSPTAALDGMLNSLGAN